jgi:hypothetical protein
MIITNIRTAAILSIMNIKAENKKIEFDKTENTLAFTIDSE